MRRTRFLNSSPTSSEDEEALALRSAIQDVVMEHRWRYGYRRVAEVLRTQGWIVNHKRIARIMREDNLLTSIDSEANFAIIFILR